MSSKVDYFIDEVTEEIYKLNFPFICWEISLSFVEVTVRDRQGNRVRQYFDRRLISDADKHLAHYVVDNIARQFHDKRYDKPYEFDIKKWRDI